MKWLFLAGIFFVSGAFAAEVESKPGVQFLNYASPSRDSSPIYYIDEDGQFEVQFPTSIPSSIWKQKPNVGLTIQENYTIGRYPDQHNNQLLVYGHTAEGSPMPFDQTRKMKLLFIILFSRDKHAHSIAVNGDWRAYLEPNLYHPLMRVLVANSINGRGDWIVNENEKTPTPLEDFKIESYRGLVAAELRRTLMPPEYRSGASTTYTTLLRHFDEKDGGQFTTAHAFAAVMTITGNYAFIPAAQLQASNSPLPFEPLLTQKQCPDFVEDIGKLIGD